MSDLKELVGLGNASVFPGHILSPPRLIEFAEAEEEAAAQYLRGIAKSAGALPAAVRDAMHQRAVDNLRSHPFSYGSLAFDQWALSMLAAPFLAWLLLRIKHPKMTLSEASQLLCDGEYMGKIGTIWELWGYKPKKKAAAPLANAAPAEKANPSTGGGSSNVSPIEVRGAAD
jgi:hypothetical protein